MLLIGSQAAKYFDDKIWDSPNDIDLIATYDEFIGFISCNNLTATPLDKNKFLTMWHGIPTEIEIAWAGSTAESLIELLSSKTQIRGHKEYFNGLRVIVPGISWLFTLKSSHKYKKDNPFFLKTMKDYRIMKDDLGCVVMNEAWHKAREEETYNRPRPRLDRDKKDFFAGDGIDYKYDHDTLHEAMKHLEKPAYLYYAKDGHEVLSDKQKWLKCSEELKLQGVLEETYVLSLERSQIPYGDTVDPFDSFKIALEKVCTSITSGWFRAYAYENYDRVMQAYDPKYVEKFNKALEEGIVKPFANEQ